MGCVLHAEDTRMRPKQNAEVNVLGEASSVLHAAWEKGWSLKKLEEQIKLKGGDSTQLFPEVGSGHDGVRFHEKKTRLQVLPANKTDRLGRSWQCDHLHITLGVLLSCAETAALMFT